MNSSLRNKINIIVDNIDEIIKKQINNTNSQIHHLIEYAYRHSVLTFDIQYLTSLFNLIPN